VNATDPLDKGVPLHEEGRERSQQDSADDVDHLSSVVALHAWIIPAVAWAREAEPAL